MIKALTLLVVLLIGCHDDVYQYNTRELIYKLEDKVYDLQKKVLILEDEGKTLKRCKQHLIPPFNTVEVFINSRERNPQNML